MNQTVVLASASIIRRKLLHAAGVPLEVKAANVDEEALRRSLIAEGATPIEMSTALAEFKSRRVSRQYEGQLIIGCDQILEFEKTAYGKVIDMDAAKKFLLKLRAQTHILHAAAVICVNEQPIWRSLSSVEVTFRYFSDKYLDAYLKRGGASLLNSVGCYHIEGEGIRLIANLSGDIYAVYGLPMIELLGYLTDQGILER